MKGRKIIRQVLPVSGILAQVKSPGLRRIAWERARAKLVKQIRALESLEAVHGTAWVEGQKRYWVMRLAEMDRHEPK